MPESQDFSPFYFLPGIKAGDDWHFQNSDNTITISDGLNELEDILTRANGHNSLDAILKQYEQDGKDTERAKRIVQDLQRLGILIDSREIAIRTHSSTNNPQTFNRSLSSQDVLDITFNDTYEPLKGEQEFYFDPAHSFIEELSSKRESCRNFSPAPVETEKLMACLRNAYSAETHPVPSAGGLYPLRLYTLQKVDSPTLAKGIYHYDHTSHKLTQLDSEFDELELSFIFGNESLLHDAPTIVVIAADLQRQSSKYANRGYRYSLLEAGHSAQNIHLTACELGLTSLEFGGFRDDDLTHFLDMPKNEKPLVAVAIGYENSEPIDQEPGFDTDLIKGTDKPVEWSYVHFSSDVAKLLKFYKATAKFRKPNSAYGDEENLFASGTASSPQLAEVKAVAEAFERFIAGQLRYDRTEAAINLGENEWLSPDHVRPLSDEQLRQAPYLEKFDPHKPIQWIKGEKVDGTEVYVPVDLVFYPIDLSDIDRSLVAEVDSSGMAAHVDHLEAAKRALLELVERDAIMKTWLSKKAPDKISTGNLPIFYQKRAEFWRKLDKTYEVLDFGHDDIAIVGVIIRSQNGGYPFMVSGASASVDSFEEALKKADHEAELGAAEFVTAQQRVARLRPADVFSPADHANFYAYNDYAHEIEWLWSGSTRNHIDKISGHKDILADYNPVIVRLTDESIPLQVVRVICPELVPISFGSGKEIYLHPAVKSNDYRQSNVPHFFA